MPRLSVARVGSFAHRAWPVTARVLCSSKTTSDTMRALQLVLAVLAANTMGACGEEAGVAERDAGTAGSESAWEGSLGCLRLGR